MRALLKRGIAVLLAICLCMLCASCGKTSQSPQTPPTTAPTAPKKENPAPVPQELKILCIGNSFSADTIEHVANIAKAMGVKKVKLANMYIGGCSIKKHYDNAVNDKALYEYYYYDGLRWRTMVRKSIRYGINAEDWDWISIQHGTADGSRYTEEGSYDKLPDLVAHIRSLADKKTKIAFNMTWVGEPRSHEEYAKFGQNQKRYYQAVAKLTKELIVPMDGIDCVSPTGTAIQNARTSELGLLTRDNYHLSKDVGRYIAGLMFFKALTRTDISSIEWAPDGVSEYARAVAIESVNHAFERPFEITACTVKE